MWYQVLRNKEFENMKFTRQKPIDHFIIDFYYYSFDGGFTWTEGRLTSTLGVWGDPCVIFDAEGNLYYSHLSNPQDGDFIDRIVVQLDHMDFI